jgi:hypothetical protein
MVICSWYSGGRIGVLQTWSSCNALMCAVYHQEKGRVHWVTPAALLSIIFLHPSLVLCLILCCHYFVSLFSLPYSIKRWHWISFWSRSEPCSGSGIITNVWSSWPRKSRRPCSVFATDIHSLQELARSKSHDLFHSVSSPMKVCIYSWVNASFLPWSTCYCRHCIHWGGGKSD